MQLDIFKSGQKISGQNLSNHNKVYEYFKSLTPEHRKRWKEQYERELSILNGSYDPGVYPITDKRSGQRKPYPEKMSWMREAWENGLKILNEVIVNHG